ncbi:serine--tRNA ligase [Malassezia sp. CBS 17886]|nr:serine--tRNA ligase [Malassezia sp. CBS 17886]
MSKLASAGTSKPTDYKGRFTRTRHKYDRAMSRRKKMHAEVTKMIEKQMQLQEEIDFILDAIAELRSHAAADGALDRVVARARRLERPALRVPQGDSSVESDAGYDSASPRALPDEPRADKPHSIDALLSNDAPAEPWKRRRDALSTDRSTERDGSSAEAHDDLVDSSTAAAPFRPLPDLAVSWRASAEDMAEARRTAQERNVKFCEEDADTVVRLHAHAGDMRRRLRALEGEQRAVGTQIPALAKQQHRSEALAQLRTRARALRTEVRELAHALADATARTTAIRSAWPNRTHPDAPRGDEGASLVVAVDDARAAAFRGAALPPLRLPRTVAEMDADTALQDALPHGPQYDHLAVASELVDGGVDMGAGLVATGPSWPYLVGSLTILEHALCQYALSVAVAHGFTPVSVPDVIKTDVAERCGFQPRAEAAAQTYHVAVRAHDVHAADSALCLAGTAEVPLAALVAKQTYGEKESLPLPRRLTALGHAFRAEAGARGTDTRGLYRIHQFSKVELFVVAEPAQSGAVLDELRRVQEEVVRGLGLLYRVVDMASEELGASAYRKYDIEAWMPGRAAWGEISSASNCTDFQAHRLAVKYRPRVEHGSARAKLQYAHTLNATAAAVPRLIVALLETYGGEGGGGAGEGSVVGGKRYGGTGAGSGSSGADPGSGGTDGRKRGLTLPSTLRRFWLGPVEGVRWLDRTVSRAAARQQHRALAPAAVRAYSVMRFADAKKAIVRRAAELGTNPGMLLVSFLILHELTAIIPLVLIAVALGVLGGGHKILNVFQHLIASAADLVNEGTYADTFRAMAARSLALGERTAARFCEKWSLQTTDEHGNRTPLAVWSTSITAAYLAVKLLMPVRVAVSLALAPSFARAILRPMRAWRAGRHV